MMKRIPYGRQWVDDRDIEAVVEVLKSDFLTTGPKIGEFESAVAGYCRVPHAVAASNATMALHLACLAAGLGKGDRLWTSPNSFVASANCGLYCGADVDFVDIDPCTLNMSVEALEAKLVDADRRGVLPKAVIPVHFAGLSCEMEAIWDLSRKYGFTVIEDASHAIGGDYLGQKVGSCRYSHMAVFSFHPVKIITTGEGGMVLARDEKLARKIGLLRHHGITRDETMLQQKGEGAWYYEQQALGMNYRMSDIQAVLGLSQLRRVDEFVRRRNELAARYTDALAGLPLSFQALPEYARSAYHLFVVRLKLGEIRKTRKAVFEALTERGIVVNVHYIPIHTQPYYRALGFRRGQFPEAERYYEETLTLPLYPMISDSQQDRVISAVREVLA